MASKRDIEKDLLIRSEKMAALGRLTSKMAHQILNPVNIMSMRLQLLKRRDDLPGDIKKMLAGCETQLNRITEIMDDLRPFSKTYDEQRTPCDLNALIENVLNVMTRQLTEKSINTATRFHPDLPRIPLDQHRMERVFLNLISNAAEAMADEDVKNLGIATMPSPSDKALQIIISDTGSGIHELDLPKVFDPYFTTKKSREHMGLGLFISYNVVKQHGGKIWVENNDRGGASFLIELPTNGAALPDHDERDLQSP
jgi:signal transduction histidine kinase